MAGGAVEADDGILFAGVGIGKVFLEGEADGERLGVQLRLRASQKAEAAEIFRLDEGVAAEGREAGLFESEEPAIGHEASALGGVMVLVPLGVGPALIEEDEFAGWLEGRGDDTELFDGGIGGDADPDEEQQDNDG